MANPYYTFSPSFVPGTKVRSDQVNTQYQGIETAFDLLPSSVSSLTLATATFAGTTGGTGNSYTATAPDTRLSNADGEELVFIADRDNTGAATLNVDGIGAQPIVRADGTALTAGDLATGIIYGVRYDLTNSRWQLMGPSTSYLTDVTASTALAVASATAAGNSESAAATSESNAATSESNALASANLAQQWAVHPEDDDVDGFPGQFSAFHWAKKAEASASLAAGSITNSTLYWDGSLWSENTSVLNTTTGVELRGSLGNDPATSGVQDALLSLTNSGGLSASSVGHDGTTDLRIDNFIHGGAIKLYSQDVSGVEQKLITADPDGGAFAYYAGAPAIGTRSNGIELRGIGTNDPALGGTQNLQIDFLNASAVRIGRIDWASSTDMDIENSVHGGKITITGQNTATGATKKLLQADPDTGVSLYYNGTERVRTNSLGLEGLGSFTLTADDIDFVVQDSTDAVSNFIWRDWSASLLYLGTAGDANVTLRSDLHLNTRAIKDTATNNKKLLTYVADAGVELYYNNVKMLETTSVGTRSTGSRFYLENTAATATQFIAYNTAGGYGLLASSGSVDLRQTDNTGAIGTSWILANKDAGVYLYYNGAISAGTLVNGIQVLGSSSNDPALSGTQNTLLNFLNSSSVAVGQVQWSSSINMTIDNRVHGGEILLRSENSSGTITSLFRGNPDGSSKLYYANAIKLSTTSSGIQISGTQADVNNSGAATPAEYLHRNSEGGVKHTADGGNYTLSQTDSTGSIVGTWMQAIQNGGIGLRYNSVVKLSTTSAGMQVSGTQADVNNSGTGTAALYIQRNSEGGVRHTADAGNYTLSQTDSTGALQATWLQAIKNGAIDLRYADVVKLSTTSAGADVTGSILNVAVTTDSTINIRALNSVAGISLDALSTSGNGRITQRTNAGVSDGTYIDFVRNARVGLHYNGTEALRTADRTASDINSGAEVVDGGGTFRVVGFNVLPINGQTGTAYTVVKADGGKVIEMNNAAANTVTLPNVAAIPIGATVNIVQLGAGATSVKTATGVTMYFSDGTSAAAKTVTLNNQYAWVTAVKKTDTAWYVTGAAA